MAWEGAVQVSGEGGRRVSGEGAGGKVGRRRRKGKWGGRSPCGRVSGEGGRRAGGRRGRKG